MSSPNMNSEYEEIFADKPKDWPANNREQTLDLISNGLGSLGKTQLIERERYYCL